MMGLPQQGRVKKTSHSAHTSGEPSPEANQATRGVAPYTTLHHLIPRVLGSALVNRRKALLDIDFLDRTSPDTKKQQTEIDTFTRKIQLTPLPSPLRIQPN